MKKLWSKIKYMKHFGLPVLATIEEIRHNENVSLEGQHPYQVICKYIDHSSLKIYYFSSEYIWYDPSTLLLDNVVRVYVNPSDYSDYFMDLNRILPKLTKKS